MTAQSIVIFGGTGDLTYRKLLPSLYNLYAKGKWKAGYDILAIGRRDYDDAAYRESAAPWIRKFAQTKMDDENLAGFLGGVHYLEMDFTDSSQYGRFSAYEKAHPATAVIIYLAVAPRFFTVIAEGVAQATERRDLHIVLEKPFGDDLPDATKLNTLLVETFGKDNIYRIDHYLGKEMVRNILAIRCGNLVFSRLWDNQSIASVQISALEQVGVETRGGYYDQSGAMKDMVQNHLLQILTIVALENPSDASTMHEQQLDVISHLRPVTDAASSVVFGQYEGYRNEDKVSPVSTTETYVALRLFIDTPRWKDVPFLLRTGKKCDRREIEVVITFKRVDPQIDPDVLVIKIQPTEGVDIRFNIKKPGDEGGLAVAEMDFCQSCQDIFHLNTPEAYERMLEACMHGDATWFSQWNQIETSWKFINALRKACDQAGVVVFPYKQGSAGPKEADLLALTPDERFDAFRA